MAVQENIDEVISSAEAKRRLREFGESCDARKGFGTPLLNAAATGAGVAIAARLLGRGRRGVGGGKLVKLLVVARIISPLVRAMLAGQNASRGVQRASPSV